MKTAYVYPFTKRWGFLLGLVVLLVMNYLSNAIPIGGMTNADVSARYPTLITPAGYAFAIWGLIYGALIVFGIFQLTRGKHIRFYNLIWPYFMLNVVANSLWLVAFQNEWFIASLVLMAALVFSLAAMFRIFYRIKRGLSTTHRFFFHVPFGIYFGWVSVAGIVNVAVALTAYEVEFFLAAPELWAAVTLTVGFVLAMFFLLSQKDFIFPLTVIWAYVAIMLAHYDVDAVRYTAKVAAIILAGATAVKFAVDRLRIGRYGRSSS